MHAYVAAFLSRLLNSSLPFHFLDLIAVAFINLPLCIPSIYIPMIPFAFTFVRRILRPVLHDTDIVHSINRFILEAFVLRG